MHSSRRLQLEQATLMVCVCGMNNDFLKKIEFALGQFPYLTLKNQGIHQTVSLFYQFKSLFDVGQLSTEYHRAQ